MFAQQRQMHNDNSNKNVHMKVAVNMVLTINPYWTDKMIWWDIIMFSISENVVIYIEVFFWIVRFW